jgi:hypothetical protein
MEGRMSSGTIDWAGVRFVPMFHHDGRFFRCPGLFAFVSREGDERTLLFVDQAENISAAVEGHRVWADALALGFNELNINLKVPERIDRLILRARIIKRCSPLLNLLEEGSQPKAEPPVAPARWRA